VILALLICGHHYKNHWTVKRHWKFVLLPCPKMSAWLSYFCCCFGIHQRQWMPYCWDSNKRSHVKQTFFSVIAKQIFNVFPLMIFALKPTLGVCHDWCLSQRKSSLHFVNKDHPKWLNIKLLFTLLVLCWTFLNTLTNITSWWSWTTQPPS